MLILNTEGVVGDNEMNTGWDQCSVCSCGERGGGTVLKLCISQALRCRNGTSAMMERIAICSALIMEVNNSL